jgi:S1-C subfamily serine protease
VNGELADKEGLKEVKGVFVAKVNPGSAAEDAGIKDKDVIVKVGDVMVNSSAELQEQVGKRNPGDKLKVLVLRDGREKEFEVLLKNKDGKTGLVKTDKVETDKALNSEFESIGRDERLKLKIGNGVRLKKADEKSVLKKAGIPNGFIIISIDKKPVYTPSDVKRALSDKKGGVLLEGVNPDGSKGYYGFGLDDK